MNKLFFTFIIASFFFGNLHAQDTVAIANSAKIVQASGADKKAAEVKTQTMIGNYGYADSLYSGTLFWIGPKLWMELKDLEEFRVMHLSNLSLPTPEFNKKGKETGEKINAYGKLIQSRENYEHFWEYVLSAYNVKGAKIVAMNEKDKFIYWQYYGQIDEPIVVIQSDKGRLMLKFKGGKLMFAELTARSN
ncbi:MAG: hypothetical protein M3R17_19525 [Bacteroidota bacterium]|nr:hypothetical protein [Bacteroidota bacterium]